MNQSLVSRVERTLELMHRWGYAPTLESLADELIGGSAEPDPVVRVLNQSGRFALQGGFVCLRGHEDLIEQSRARVRTNRLANGKAKAIAERFARELSRICPFVECIALSGSVASGGYVPTDDIDFDLVVRDGTKYLTYAVALALGLGFAIRYRDSGPLRKVTCINVVWTRPQTAPFVRNDAHLAFELLHCRPIIGAAAFRQILAANPWIERYFPQVTTAPSDEAPRPVPSLLGRLLGWVASRPGALAIAERLGRTASFAAYRTAHWLRRNDAAAIERLRFLQRAKYPYEVFQD